MASLLKGGGVSFGKNVDLCTVPYGAFGTRGGSSDPPDPPSLATGLRRESISRRTAEMETPEDQEMLVTIVIAYYYMKRVKKRKNRQIWVHRINLRRREQAISFQAL